MAEEEQKREVIVPKKNISPESESHESTEIISQNILEYAHGAALVTEDYETAALAADEVQSISDYRAKIRTKRFARFFDIFEDVTNINNSGLSPSAKKEHIRARAIELSQKAGRFSPRVADLYQGILASIAGEVYEPVFETTADKLQVLQKNDDIRALVDGVGENITWEIKLNRIEERLIPWLGAHRLLDKREGKTMNYEQTPEERALRVEKLEKMNGAPARPPNRRNESKPSMDEMERLKEGERVPAVWSIFPPYGGYYREQSFSQWDSTRNVWTEPDHEFVPAVFVDKCENEDPKNGIINFTMKATVRAGGWVSLPIPYTHGLHSISADSGDAQAMQDENGDIVVMVSGNGETEITVVASPQKDKVYGPTDPNKAKVPNMPAQFSEETMAELQRVIKTKSGNGPRAMALASYVRRTIKYSNESKYNEIYDNDPDGYFASIDKHQKADCDVANTYFAALCAQLNIPIRHVVGHSVKGKDLSGAANINSATGHGWSEVWNEKVGAWERLPWVRVDATPPGDPNLEENEKGESIGVPGDYGEQEAIRPTDEQLEQLRQKLAERKEKLSYTKRERDLAEATGVDLKTARAIVKELNETDQTCLPNGERIVDVLGDLFSAIVKERRNITPAYDGPVRRSEGGGAITHIVPHFFGIIAGEPDPESRELLTEKIEKEEVFGGLNLYLIGDKSGSMQHTVDGENLWQMQRRAIYLIFSSLYRFENSIKGAHLPDENSLDVKTGCTSFRGDTPEEIDKDKPLSPTFTDPNRVTLWNSLTNQGGGNGDATALQYVYEQIIEEIENEKKSKTPPRSKIRLVVACSDGGYVGSEVKMQELAEALHELGVVVVGMGLTEQAASVPVVMNNPPYSRGDIARDINDLPALIAKHLILEAIKLFPDHTKKDVQKTIEEIIQKFSKL